MTLNLEDLESIRLLQNNTPLEDFSGLTPSEMHGLLYDTFGSHSPLKIRTDINDRTLDNIPFFRLTEEFLKLVQREGFIKLTPLGALPRKILHELYSRGWIKDEAIESGITKLTREVDCLSLGNMHINAHLVGAIRKANGKLTLTKKGQRLLQKESRVELFKETLSAFTAKFNWAFNDGHTERPVGQLGWGYTVLLLSKFGEKEQKLEFYVDCYLKAFPRFLDFFTKRQFGTPEEEFTACYAVRTFDRFLEWFGFVKVGRATGFLHRFDDKVVRSDLLVEVFQFD